MDVRKYKYSYLPMGYGMAKIAILTFIFYQMTAILSLSYKWMYAGIGFLIFGGWFIYLMVKAGVPFFRGKTVLELDNEKLQYFVKELVPLQHYRAVINWKDVKDIEFVSLPRAGTLITFRITDGGNDASIRPNYVAWNTDDLYQTILKYHENSK